MSCPLPGNEKIVFTKNESLTLETFSKMKLLSEGEKQALLAFCCDLAFADGSVYKKEVQFSDKLSDAIDFKNPFDLVADDGQENTPSITPKWKLHSHQAPEMVEKMLLDTMM